MNLDRQIDYSNTFGVTKRFSHPVNMAWMRQWVPQSGRILDYGCGYGRVLGILQSEGYTKLRGLDTAPAMISAAKMNYPSIAFDVLETDHRLNLPDGSFDVATLFAVLTSIPTDAGQRDIMSEITRLLQPRRCAVHQRYVLQDDPRNRDRYTEGQKKYGVYGVFDLPEGVTCRHHDESHIEMLTANFDQLAFQQISIETMNGVPASAFQWLGRL